MLIIEQPILAKLDSLSLEMIKEGVVLSINKPYGWTSADVVRKIKFMVQRHWEMKEIKVGHAGTLDPLATGVLLICIGKATKAVQTLQGQKKEYIASICLGATTPCFDLEKEIDQTYPYTHITEEAVKEVLQTMTGPHEQMPPQFSAKIVNGARAYNRARSGIQTELIPAHIEIYETKLLVYNLPNITIQIRCSKGTYIRAFARDLGKALQSGAHLTNLIRSQNGSFHVANSIDISFFEKILA